MLEEGVLLGGARGGGGLSVVGEEVLVEEVLEEEVVCLWLRGKSLPRRTGETWDV